MERRYRIMGSLAGLVVLLDQLTKLAVIMTLELGRVVEVIPGFFNLVHVLNRGAAFGILNRGDISWQRWFFVGVSLLAMTVIGYMAHKSRPEEKLLHGALGLILGGACGNFIDRLHTGMVIDFLDFYVGRFHWPAFNVADSAITVGALLLIVSFYSAEGRRPREKS